MHCQQQQQQKTKTYRSYGFNNSNEWMFSTQIFKDFKCLLNLMETNAFKL